MARPYQQHGLHTLKRRLKVSGLAGIDGRSQAARALLRWRHELEQDLGGAAVISAQMAAVIDLAATSKLLLDSVDRYLLELPSLVNKRRRSLFAVVLQRQQLADALSRYMAQLGLERRRPAVKSLDDYVRERYGARSDEIRQAAQAGTSAPPTTVEPEHEEIAPQSASAELTPGISADPPPGDPASRIRQAEAEAKVSRPGTDTPPSDTQGETDRCLSTAP